MHHRDLSILLLGMLVLMMIPSPVLQLVDREGTASEPENQTMLADDYEQWSSGNLTGLELSTMNISVVVDGEDATANGTLVLDYYNAENIALDEIPFHLYPSGMYYDTRQGEIDILNVTSRGTSPEVIEFEVLSSSQLMWITLEDTIAPGEYLLLNFTFRTILPEGTDRSGVHGTDGTHDRILTFSGFYPIPCVYDQYDGWNTDPYIHEGDPFYFDMAYHDLRIDAPEDLVIAATGTPTDIISSGGRMHYHYEIAYPVREVTFSASRHYQTESEIFNGVNVTTFYLPSSYNVWHQLALHRSIQSLDLFNQTYGIYPYPTLNVVEQHAYYGGMEYPCQVYITRAVAERIQEGTYNSVYHEVVISHEIAHQWWSQMVGDDCIDWGFLDEGLTCWSHSFYAEHYHGDWEYFQLTTYLDSVRTFYATYQSGSVINESNLVRPELTGFVDYTQTPLILEKLRQTIGPDIFLEGMRLFFRSHYFQIATLNNLQDAFEVASGQDLDWFFFPWFSNGYLPDYDIRDAIFHTSNSTLVFTIFDHNEDVNDYEYSQQVPIEVYDLANRLLTESVVWVNGTTTYSVQLNGVPNSIHLDYIGYVIVQLPDTSVAYYSVSDIAMDYGMGLVYVGIIGVVAAVIILVVAPTVYIKRRSQIDHRSSISSTISSILRKRIPSKYL